jgi:hypothetical protein
MTSDFSRKIVLSPLNPVWLNIISNMTDVGERKKKQQKQKKVGSKHEILL